MEKKKMFLVPNEIQKKPKRFKIKVADMCTTIQNGNPHP